MLVETGFSDFPFEDPRATAEYLGGVRESSDGSFDTYHHTWLGATGLSANSAIAHDHKTLLEALGLGLVYDQINLSNSAMAEQITRRLIQHELAVEKDPRHPDYSGLGSLLAGATEEKGRLAIPRFSRAVAERQAQRAQIPKQARLLREEKFAEGKRRKAGKTPKGGGKGDPPAASGDGPT